MKFSRLLRESQLFWPSSINISDGELKGSDGGYFPTLSKEWNLAEERQQKINEWHDIMSWPIFCGFHKLACEKLKRNDIPLMYFNEIDFDYVESKLLESLNATYPSWSKYMRIQYRNNKN